MPSVPSETPKIESQHSLPASAAAVSSAALIDRINNLSEASVDIDLAFKRSVAQDEIKTIIKDLSVGESRALNELSPWVITHAPFYEKGELLAQLIALENEPARQNAIGSILDSLGISNQVVEIKEFFQALVHNYFGSVEHLLSIARSEQEKVFMAEYVVEGMLHELAAKHEDPAVRARFEDPTISTRELVEVLAYIEPSKRIDFLRALVVMANSSEDVRFFISSKVDNVLHFMSVSERIEALQMSTSSGQSVANAHIIAAILRSSRDFNELNLLVEAVGKESLVQLGDPTIREYVAHAQIGTLLRNLTWPALTAEDALPEDIETSVEQIEQALWEAVSILSCQEIADSQAAQDYCDILMYELEYLEGQRNEVASWEELRQLADLMVKKIGLEIRYCIKLSHSDKSELRLLAGPEGWEFVSSAPRKWTVRDLSLVESALSKLSEGLLLTTPLLSEIRRVDYIGDGVAGARFGDGLLKIADGAVDNLGMWRLYPGRTSLEVVLIHEVGHGIQLGIDGGGVIHFEGSNSLFTAGDQRYDFYDFLQISGWSVIEPDRYEVSEHGGSVKLDGEEYPLQVAIKHNGQEITLIANNGLLFSYNTYAPFSIWGYGRTNPWEDWAVAFTEYHLAPERLITFAPEKFRYFEQEFSVYRDREELQEMCSRNIEKRRLAYSADLMGKESLAASE